MIAPSDRAFEKNREQDHGIAHYPPGISSSNWRNTIDLYQRLLSEELEDDERLAPVVPHASAHVPNADEHRDPFPISRFAFAKFRQRVRICSRL